MPVPSISGTAPSSAAIVVIMIGRKRSSAALRIASSVDRCSVALGDEREVDEHDAVLLDDADQQDDADHGDQAEIEAEQHQRRSARRHPPTAASTGW